MRRQQLQPPAAKRRQIENPRVFWHHSGSDAFPPLWVRHAYYGTIGHCGMFPKNFLNFQRRYLVSSRFHDVNACTAKNSVNTVFYGRRIASAKPAIAEGSAGCFGLVPIFPKHARTAHFYLSCRSRSNRVPVVSDQLNINVRQRPTDAPRYAVAV